MQADDDIKIIAHRAGNNVFSIDMAIANGADFIELDLHLSKDNALVVQHQPYIINGKSSVYIEDCNISELNSLDILLFEQVLEKVKNKNIKILVDIKKGRRFYNDISNIIVNEINKYSLIDMIEFLSFDHKCILNLRNINPNIRAGIMYVARMVNLKEYLKLCQPSFVEICGDYLDEEAVHTIHSLGIDTYGWGCDEESILKYYKSIGMYAVTVDDVENAVRILKE